MTPTHPADSWALILAGGDGTRLQSLTRAITGRPIPKQYCRIDGERSLLEWTLDRLRGVVPLRRTLAVIAEAHRELALAQLGHLPRATSWRARATSGFSSKRRTEEADRAPSRRASGAPGTTYPRPESGRSGGMPRSTMRDGSASTARRIRASWARNRAASRTKWSPHRG